MAEDSKAQQLGGFGWFGVGALVESFMPPRAVAKPAKSSQTEPARERNICAPAPAGRRACKHAGRQGKEQAGEYVDRGRAQWEELSSAARTS